MNLSPDWRHRLDWLTTLLIGLTALEWVIDQYQVKTDTRSGITNDPNRPEDETYVLRLVKQVITVSLETVAIVEGLPAMEIIEE